MDLSEYFIMHDPVRDAFVYGHRPSHTELLTTQHISLDTLMRLAVVHNAATRNIRL